MKAECGSEKIEQAPGTRSGATWSGGGELGRRAGKVAALLTAIVVVAGVGAGASWTKGSKPSYLSGKLAQKAKADPNALVRVIIQSDSGVTGAANAFNGQARTLDGDKLGRKLNLVGAVSVQIKAKKLEKLAQLPGLTITPDDPMKASSLVSNQLWPYVSGNAAMWTSLDSALFPHLPTIAVVDSGIECNRADFTGRVVATVNLATAAPNSPCDGYGHGTFVAGIAAGSALGYAGSAPAAKIASLDVMNDDGMAYTSDVIAAADWIMQNRVAFNIRVANFSLHSGSASSFTHDPLDKAVEKLWFNGVTVVAASGNYGDGTASGVRFAPGNDPFVITVGAADLGGTASVLDDTIAPWSAYGYTYDGFAKPEISAPGRYMVGPAPALSTLAAQRPDHVVAPGYMQLSGTSFAAPVVAGAVAHILAVHPSYTPDQVKGALMVTARALPLTAHLASGVGELNAIQAATFPNPPNPNLALNQFLVTDPIAGGTSFDAASWSDAAAADASWSDASWSDASWSDASWSDASWSDASWSDASWSDASWSDASWSDASWSDASWSDASWSDAATENAAQGDANGNPFGYALTPSELAALNSDPAFTPLTPLP